MSPRASVLRVRHGRLHSFARETLTRVLLPPEPASHCADALVAANLTGEDGEGVKWLPGLVGALSARHLNPQPRMRIAASSGGTLVLDGDNGPGPAVARRAMREAISAASRHGVGAAAVRRSNRTGSPGHFAALALSHQMAGVALTGAPPLADDPQRDTAFHPIGVGIAVPTAETAPPTILSLKVPSPDRESGMALALALESLVLLGGGALASELARELRPEPTHRGTGHLFLAFRIRAFAPWAGFRNRMVERLTQLRRARMVYPGQRAAAVEEERRMFGIPLDPETAGSLKRLALQLDLDRVWNDLARPARRGRRAGESPG